MNLEVFTENPTIEFLQKGYIAPLTKLDAAKDGNPGKFDGGVYYNTGKICALGKQLKGSYLNEPALFSSQRTEMKMSGNYVFGGMLQNEHFGHFLAESLSRLWALKTLDKAFNSVVFYLRMPKLPVASFVKEIFSLLIPQYDIKFVEVLTEFEKLAVPSQVVHPKIGFIYGHSFVRDLLLPLRFSKSHGPRRVYISRSKLKPQDGGILLEELIERNLAAQGYYIVHPQELSIQEQIQIYNIADELIFSEGSAIHLYALVARPEQRVFIVWRRKMSETFNWQVQSFGGGKVKGIPCIEKIYIPERDKGETVHARAKLDFNKLSEHLYSEGFIRDLHWPAPCKEEFEMELTRLQNQIKSPFVESSVYY